MAFTDPEGPAEVEWRAARDKLERQHPEASGLVDELSDATVRLWIEAYERGARRQGRLIQAALNGEVVCWSDTDPVDVSKPFEAVAS